MFLLRQQIAKKTDQKLTWIELGPLAKKQSKEESRRRIVQTDPGEKTDQVKEDAFLGWQNQTVDRQIVSKNKRTIVGSSSPSSSTPSTSKTEKNSKNTLKELSKWGVPLIPLHSSGEKDEPQWATPGTRPEDTVPGMKESDRTALNTKEYLFYGYFQRIRARLDRAWIPILREKLISYYRSGRQLASEMSHTTQVMVTLNDKGEIVKVQLLGQSGTQDLDDAAIAAFNRAGPFPNPPHNMIDSNHEVKIPWDFILKT